MVKQLQRASDNLVGLFSPKAKLSRLKFRAYTDYIEGAGFSRHRINHPQILMDNDKVFDVGRREDLMSTARRLYANMGEVRSVIKDLATYSTVGGFVPQSRSEDRAWADQAETFFWNAAKIADVTGRFTFWDHLWLTVVDINVDGDNFYILSESGNGFPQLQAVRAHRVKAEPEDKTVQGVFLNAAGRPTAYKIAIGDNKFRRVQAQSVIHNYDAESTDQTRGLTHLAHAAAALMDMQDIKGAETTAVKMSSMIGMLKRTPTGMDTDAFDQGTTTDQDPLQLEDFKRGQIPIVGGGLDFEAFKNDRPSPAWHGLMDHLLKMSCMGMGWPFFLAFQPDKLTGPAVRLEIAKAEKAIKRTQQILMRFANRYWQFAISRGIQIGMLPPAPPDWWNVDWTPPARLSIDAGRDAAADLNDWKSGLKTAQEHYASRGLDYEEQLTQRAKECRLVQDLATEFDVPPQKIANLGVGGTGANIPNNSIEPEPEDDTNPPPAPPNNQKRNEADE